jgi:purine nucleosidase
MALVYLLASKEAELVGIASTSGNVAAQQVCINNLGLLELCGAEAIPVSKGADEPLSCSLRTAEDTHGPQGLGYAQLPPNDRKITAHNAAEAWVRAAHAHPGELIGLVTGPMTNLALALRAEPALPSLLQRLVIMGGSFGHRGNTDVVAEWNISVDPEAAEEVFAAWSGRETLPIVLGLNLTEKIVMTPATLTQLAEMAGASTVEMSVRDARGTRSVASNPLIRVVEDAVRFYFEFHFDQGEGFLAHLHDPLAAAVALDPSLVRTRTTTVGVELTGTLTRAMTIADWSGRWGRPPNAQVGVAVDPIQFFDRVVERVGPFLRRLNER